MKGFKTTPPAIEATAHNISSLTQEREYVVQLLDEHLHELDAAVADFDGHIRDLSSHSEPASRAAPYRNTELPFHTDAADVVGMYVLFAAPDGGEGIFASVAQICDTLASDDPELVEVLMRDDWPFVKPPTGGLYYTRSVVSPSPVLSHIPEAFFSRGFLIDNPESNSRRPTCVPNLTGMQAYALDAFNFAALRHALEIRWQSGDMCFFNNRRIVHGRNAFRNGQSEKQTRHILRLWLGDHQFSGEPPPNLVPRWKKIFEVRTESERGDDLWPLEPAP
ncbi:hypothetical protein NPX13_g6438 [Xylaria arbuscula]|uniref:TauD/TfdA-like domain-containing protein n=1 Tax=Xylaria arbuscula TaxID=114810 RepID=A0A9W8TK46_9PEZI|nr:hypothetical protein NPX13_g6438 [Xylaria arbuscula]